MDAAYDDEPEDALGPSERERKIFIGGLSWLSTEESLLNYFRSINEDLDRIVIMREKQSGRSRGFGFVIVSNVKSVDRVVGMTHIVDGKKIEAKKAIPKAEMNHSNRKIFVGGVSLSVEDDTFRDYFGSFGPVLESQILRDRFTQRSRGFGFVTFTDDETVDRVMKQRHFIEGKEVEVKMAEPRKTAAVPQVVHHVYQPVLVSSNLTYPHPYSYPPMAYPPMYSTPYPPYGGPYQQGYPAFPPMFAQYSSEPPLPPSTTMQTTTAPVNPLSLQGFMHSPRSARSTHSPRSSEASSPRSFHTPRKTISPRTMPPQYGPVASVISNTRTGSSLQRSLTSPGAMSGQTSTASPLPEAKQSDNRSVVGYERTMSIARRMSDIVQPVHTEIEPFLLVGDSSDAGSTSTDSEFFTGSHRSTPPRRLYAPIDRASRRSKAYSEGRPSRTNPLAASSRRKKSSDHYLPAFDSDEEDSDKQDGDLDLSTLRLSGGGLDDLPENADGLSPRSNASSIDPELFPPINKQPIIKMTRPDRLWNHAMHTSDKPENYSRNLNAPTSSDPPLFSPLSISNPSRPYHSAPISPIGTSSDRSRSSSSSTTETSEPYALEIPFHVRHRSYDVSVAQDKIRSEHRRYVSSEGGTYRPHSSVSPRDVLGRSPNNSPRVHIYTATHPQFQSKASKVLSSTSPISSSPLSTLKEST